MGWIWYSGKACLFSGNAGDAIFQSISQTIGVQYIIKFTISGMTQGVLRINNFEETNEFTEDGIYAVLGTAVDSTLIFTGELDEDDNLFDGCIDSVEVYSFASQSPLACSPCINVQEEQGDCLLLVTAENDNNALNFAWTDLILKARISAKFAKVEYDSEAEELDDNGGDHITTYFDGKKNRLLQVDAVPIFIHDFLFMCKGVDTFKINDVEYSIIDKYPSIIWNKSGTEGTVELKVRKKNFKLNKTNCG
jgi:hypothetical protein